MYAETPESRAAREQHTLEQRLARPLGANLGARPTRNRRGAGSAHFLRRAHGAGAEAFLTLGGKASATLFPL